jgi:carbon starvation protein
LPFGLYGKYISKKIFNISGKNSVPSIDLEDGVDYVPTKKEIIFGHHFASIAGTDQLLEQL